MLGDKIEDLEPGSADGELAIAQEVAFDEHARVPTLAHVDLHLGDR